jgi:hypothetical protein
MRKVSGWNHVCNQKQANDWPHDEVPCPTTFKREAINDTLPAKVPNGAIAVLSTIDKRAANESSICSTKGITELISCGDVISRFVESLFTKLHWLAIKKM